MEDRKRWQDGLNLVLGLWLIISPFILGYATGTDGAAAWNAYIFGIGIAVFAGAALARPAKWEEWVNLAIGAWLIISPFVLGFTGDSTALWNHLIVGLIVGIDALMAASRRTRARAIH